MKDPNQILLSLFWTLIVQAGAVCSSAAVPSRPDEDILTREFALYRKSQIASVAYEIYLEIDGKGELFEGLTAIHVDLHRVDAPLSIDILAERIKSVQVNGKSVADYTARAGSIDISPTYLKKKNHIEIAYTGRYSKEGVALHRVSDHEDGRVYFYTQFEPYDAP